MAYPPGAVPSLGDRAAAAAELERDLAGAGLRATKVDDPELARYLEAQRVLVRLGDGWAIGADGYEVARDVLVQECRHAGRITLARFRDLAGVGRRDAQLLLERFDADGLTRRLGDERVLRRGAAGA
jgi:selenocysteine-specific elongation factor